MIADDHDLVRQGLRALLDLDSALEVVGEAINGAEAVRLAHRLRPDVVETAAPGTLVLSDVIYPAWHARVDDAPAEIYVADGALRAVTVPPGKHTVQFQYASAARLARRSPG